MRSPQAYFLNSEPSAGTAEAARHFVQEARSTDIDDQAGMLVGWEQSYIQCENGSFEAAVLALTLPNSNLFQKSTNRKLQKRFAPPPNVTAFAVLLSGSDPAVFQGRPVEPGDVLLMPGGREHELICHGAFNTVVATFSNGGAYLTTGYNGFDTANTGVVKAARAARLGEWLEGVLHESLSTSGADAVADLMKIQDEMARKCAELVCVRDQTSGGAKPYERVRATQIFVTLREFVIDYLKAHDEIPTLAVVVEKLGISIRTLEYTCKSLLNVSPQRYLTCWRLHCARRDIRTHAESSSVTDVALKWGFSHLGRFSIAYRELFGEMPSRTLATSKLAVAMGDVIGVRPDLLRRAVHRARVRVIRCDDEKRSPP